VIEEDGAQRRDDGINGRRRCRQTETWPIATKCSKKLKKHVSEFLNFSEILHYGNVLHNM